MCIDILLHHSGHIMLSDFDLAKHSGSAGGMHASISKSELNGVRTLIYLESCSFVGLRLRPRIRAKCYFERQRLSTRTYCDRARLQGPAGPSAAHRYLRWRIQFSCAGKDGGPLHLAAYCERAARVIIVSTSTAAVTRRVPGPRYSHNAFQRGVGTIQSSESFVALWEARPSLFPVRLPCTG